MTREEKVAVIEASQKYIMEGLRLVPEVENVENAAIMLQAVANMATIGHFFLADITS